MSEGLWGSLNFHLALSLISFHLLLRGRYFIDNPNHWKSARDYEMGILSWDLNILVEEIGDRTNDSLLLFLRNES